MVENLSNFSKKIKLFGLLLIFFPVSSVVSQQIGKGHYLLNQVSWPWQTFPQGTGSATLLLMGDTNIQNRQKPEEAFQHLMPTFRNADVRFLNLEGPFAGTSKDPLMPDIPHKEGWQHSNPQMVEGLIHAGIDGVGVANNVTYPFKALMRSLEVLDSAHIGYTGGGKDLGEAHKPLIIERDGVKFGFIQYTTTFWPYNHAAEINRPGVATVKIHTHYKPPKQVLDKPGQPPIIITIPDKIAINRMKEDIRKTKKKADIMVASFHWGISGSEKVIDYQHTLARAAIESGADVVIGHGSHVLQAIELWKGKPIFYGLGNFVFDWYKGKDDLNGLLVKVVAENNELAQVSCLPLMRNKENNPVLLDPGEGKGKELYEKLIRLNRESEKFLRIAGKEILLEGIQ